MTLALLLTAVTGAWAQSAVASIGSENYTTLQAAFTAAETGQTIKLLSDVTQTGGVGKSDGKAVTFDLNGHIYTCTDDYSVMATYNSQITIIDSSTGTPGGIKSEHALAGQGNGKIIIKAGRYNIGGSTAEELLEYFPLWCVEMYSGYTLQDITPADAQGFCVGVVAPAPSGPKVAWDKDKKTGTFEMPGSDVVLTPIYAKAATFATTGTEPEVKTLLPEAAEGVIAGTDASLIAEGTGIVAFAAASTEVTQGTLMYAIGTSATEAPALTAFSATVPTAENVADDGADVLVWYYIQGADAPQGEAATLDNTFSDTEPVCLTVTVLTNKFDIQFNAANANTIEAGKATVTVAGAAATVTDGKLQGVKMGSEVKLEAKPGYKFRKVEVKKAEAGPLAAAFKDGAKFKVGYKWNSVNTTYLEFTNSGGTYSLTSVSGLNEANGFNSSTLTVKDGNVLALDVVCHPEGISKMDRFCAQIEFDATSSTYKYSSKGSGFTGIISVSVNDADITSQLTEAN